MITKAIDKVTAEVNKNKGDTAQALGEYLIDHMSDAWADKILADGKTLDGAIKSITDKARAKQFGGVAAIRDDVVFGWLREYYDLPEVSSKQALQIQTNMTGLQVSLADLL